MVTRIGHMTLRVPDLDRAVAFYEDVLGLRVSDRRADRAYLTCNARHHELVLATGAPAYESIGLEVADDADLDRARAALPGLGGTILGDAPTEPGVAAGLLVRGPGGHVFKLFHGMAESEPADYETGGVRPSRFEHVSLKCRDPKAMESFLQDGLGFRFSDRIGPLASWWHCDSDHHGMALQRNLRDGLHHHAWTLPDLNALGAAADRLADRGMRLVWGPGRHGPGNNHFVYFAEPSGALVEYCSDLARIGPGHAYTPRNWPVRPVSISRWGGLPPRRFRAPCVPAARGA